MGLIRLVSLRTRLVTGFVLVCGLLIWVTLIGIRISEEQERLTERTVELLVLTRELGRVTFRVSDLSGWQLSYAWEATWMGGRAAASPASPSRRSFEDSITALNRVLDAIRSSPITASELELTVQTQRLVAEFSEVDAQIVEFFRDGTPEAVRQANTLVLGASYEIARKIQKLVNELVVSVATRSAEAHQRSTSNAERGRRVQLAGTLSALLVAVAISVLITRSIVGSVGNVVAGLEALVADETAPHLSDVGRDELALIVRAFNRTASLLQAARAEQQALTARLHILACRDPLTDLLNRGEFYRRVESAVRHAKETGECVAAVLLDLNDFKPVNDRHGHAAGDTVLRAVAARLREAVRSTDLVARLGGDEFAIFFGGGDCGTDVQAVVERLDAAIRRPIKVVNGTVTVTASIGVGTDRDGRLTPEELLEVADRAMYRAKRRYQGESTADR